MYKIKVLVPDFNPITKQWKKRVLSGEFDSEEEAKEFYASELGMTEDDIEIMEVEEL